ncbi:hypothetical protein AIOL_003769 [Candidatus Rhodobacter oscarellae]|uniref:Lipopolysaccharide export system protein LptC n=1 Tax=Candidatus Rhodobacter oscarellae TaxID=1675527 RepID=A0A0J9EAU5_9RHOB|nr:hypothetical protein [Candidatus Rhodobacter lobularis]KMW58789.1 hypothetical protein AIOL_003769 [Candidatus Rhodobacter lobularis]
MVFDDNSYSRLVAWLKVVLPLAALGLLSTLFLVARTVDPAQQLPFADVDVDEIAREQRIGKPKYSGMTSEGASVSLAAQSASPAPDDANRISGETVDAEVALPNGEVIDIQADHMQLDYAAGLASLRDRVRIRTTSGLEMQTGSLDVRLDRTSVRSDSVTTVTGGLGELVANSFELKPQNDEASHYVLVFKGDVKLVYRPGR